MGFAKKMTLSKDRIDKRLIDMYKLRRAYENNDVDDELEMTKKRLYVSLDSF